MSPNVHTMRIDWQSERERIALTRVASDLMGSPPGRGRDPLWWVCPFHDDRNPSLKVDPVRQRWKCFGCGEQGDAATLVMRLHNLTFPEAVRQLTGGSLGLSTYRSTLKPRPARPVGPSGLPASEAVAMVAQSHARLWTSEGSRPLAYLMGERCLTEATIRQARLGWTPGMKLPTAAGGEWTPRGWTIPWFDGDRLTMVNLRRPDATGPKYVHAFRDAPTVFSGTFGTTRPGLPLVVVEGEFDAILLGQELADLALVISLGPASIHPDPTILDRFASYRPWYAAHDADDAGDNAAAHWPASARRVRPPDPFKDWTEAQQEGINLRRWWTDRLAGIENPSLYDWADLETWRW